VVGVPDRGFHNFRHTRAPALLAKGVPIHAVSSLIGHASVSTTDRIYNHANALAHAQWLED
jgi:integrase